MPYVVSSCEDLLPIDVSHALMEVMCEQLQNVLHTFHRQQTAAKGAAERTDLDTSSKSANLFGVGDLHVKVTKLYVLTMQSTLITQ